MAALKTSLLVKTSMATFRLILVMFGLLFISISGHTSREVIVVVLRAHSRGRGLLVQPLPASAAVEAVRT